MHRGPELVTGIRDRGRNERRREVPARRSASSTFDSASTSAGWKRSSTADRDPFPRQRLCLQASLEALDGDGETFAGVGHQQARLSRRADGVWRAADQRERCHERHERVVRRHVRRVELVSSRLEAGGRQSENDPLATSSRASRRAFRPRSRLPIARHARMTETMLRYARMPPRSRTTASGWSVACRDERCFGAIDGRSRRHASAALSIELFLGRRVEADPSPAAAGSIGGLSGLRSTTVSGGRVTVLVAAREVSEVSGCLGGPEESSGGSVRVVAPRMTSAIPPHPHSVAQTVRGEVVGYRHRRGPGP